VPLAMPSDGVTIIRAGSQLFAGTYSSKTAQCVNQQTGVQASVPLNSDGTLAQDTAFDTHSYLLLPVTASGGLTFTNGVQAVVNASLIANNAKDVTLTFKTPSTAVPSGSAENNIAGTLSFSGGETLNSGADLTLACSNSTQTAAMECTASTIAPNKTVAVTGLIEGSSFSASSIKYQFAL